VTQTDKPPVTASTGQKRTLSLSNISTSMPTFLRPTTTTAPRSSALKSSSMTPSAMSTSVRLAKNSTILRPIPRSALAGIEHAPGTAITARLKHSVPLANRGVASAVAWMKTRWIGCVLMPQPSPIRRPCASAVSGSNRCLRDQQTVAWHETLSLTAPVAGQLRGVHDCGWAKSQTTAQQTGLGTASVPSRGRVCPLFCCFWVADSSFFGVLVFFLNDWLRLPNDLKGMQSPFTDEFCESVFQQAATVCDHAMFEFSTI